MLCKLLLFACQIKNHCVAVILHLADFGVDVEALCGAVTRVSDFCLEQFVRRSCGVAYGGKALAEFPHPGSMQVDVGIHIAGENFQPFLREEDTTFIQKNKPRFALVRLQQFKQWVGNCYQAVSAFCFGALMMG